MAGAASQGAGPGPGSRDIAPVIRLENVSRIYDGAGGRVAALSDVSLHVARGEFIALMGPSGCGKSTLLHLVAGVDTPTAGEVWVDGLALSGLSDAVLSRFRRDRVGIVYQFFNLLPTMTAWENVALPALLGGASAAAARQRAEEALAGVGLSQRVQHWPHELSGGEMQRVAVARALVNGPAILLADEPTGNLDSKAGRDVLELLARSSAERGLTVVLATHSHEAAALAGRILYLKDGSLVGSP